METIEDRLTSTRIDSEIENDALKTKILRPHSSLRNIHEKRTLLVIASEGLLDIPSDLKTFTEGDNGVNVRYASKLPLQNQDRHPNIDAIALVYKVFNQDSLLTLKKYIHLIDVRLLASKCFLLIFSDDAFYDEDSIHDVREFARSYSLPIHKAFKYKTTEKDEPARLEVPPNLMSIYCPRPNCDVSTTTLLAAMGHFNMPDLFPSSTFLSQ